MRNRALVVLSLALLACACGRRRLQDQLTALDGKRASLVQVADERRNALRDATQNLDTRNSELSRYNDNVRSFILAHRIAAACIHASRSTWGENNAFSHDVSTATRFGTALCSVALLNAQFAQEVTRVADQLSEADAHVRQLKEQIAAAENEVASGRDQLERSEASLREIGAEIADVQQQMER